MKKYIPVIVEGNTVDAETLCRPERQVVYCGQLLVLWSQLREVSTAGSKLEVEVVDETEDTVTCNSPHPYTGVDRVFKVYNSDLAARIMRYRAEGCMGDVSSLAALTNLNVLHLTSPAVFGDLQSADKPSSGPNPSRGPELSRHAGNPATCSDVFVGDMLVVGPGRGGVVRCARVGLNKFADTDGQEYAYDGVRHYTGNENE